MTRGRPTRLSRPRLRRAVAALLLPVLAALVISAAAAPAASARPFVTGVSGIGDFAPLAFQRTREAGAELTRLVVPWANVAPKSQPASWNPEDPDDPHYQWGYVDEGVRQSIAAGLTPLLTVDGAPKWAQGCTSPPGLQMTEVCDPDPAKLAAFGAALARRYSGHFQNLPRVEYLQALNEPNLTLFFFPQFNTAGKALAAGLYRDLINAFYAAVKAVEPTDKVIAAGLGPTELKNYNVGPLRFTRELLCMKGGNKPKPIKGGCSGGVHFDIFDIHPYTTGGPTHQGGPNDVQMGDLGKLQTLLKAADRSGHLSGSSHRTELWITEFGWDSKPPDPNGLPFKTLDQWVAEAMHEAWSANVSHFFWYSLRDEPSRSGIPDSQITQTGLYYRGASLEADRPKPVLNVFRFPFTAFASGSGLRFWGRTPSSDGGQLAIQVQEGGRWRTVARPRADKHGVFSGRAPTSYGTDKLGAARAVFGGAKSVPFPMRRVADYYHPPFG